MRCKTKEGLRRPAVQADEILLRGRIGDGADLKQKSVRSATVTFGSHLAAIVLQTVSTVVLARLLTPQDYGVVAMVIAVTVFARLFQDMGLSTATIQRERLTHGQASTLFWINGAVGLLLSVLVAALAPVLAWFYHQPEVRWVTVVSSANFLIGGMSVQHTALLKRSMRFNALGVVQIAGAAAAVVVAIAAAHAGLGYWSLVWSVLAGTICRAALLWTFSGWLPGRLRRGTGARSLLHFGANVTGFEVANYFSRNLDNLLIGRFWGPELLGLYSRAYSLLMFPLNHLRDPLGAVAFPALCHLQDDPGRYRQYFKRYLSLLAFASMPLVAFLFVCSHNVILLLLGSRWTEASSIFSILAISSFIQVVYSTRGLPMLTTGKSRRYFQFGIWNALSVSAGFAIGVYWGAKGVAISYAVVNYALLYPMLVFCYRDTPVRVRDFFEAIARAGVASLFAGSATFWARSSWPSGNNLMVLLGCAAIFSAAYFIAFLAIPGGASELRKYRSYVSVMFARGRTRAGETNKARVICSLSNGSGD